MKRLLIVLLLLIGSMLCADTWIRNYQWTDLCPGPYTDASAEVYNVIPAIGGGYLLQGHVEFIWGDIPAYANNVFWNIAENGEVIWRRTDGGSFAFNSIVSNGTDRYYCLKSHQGISLLYVYDTEMNCLLYCSFQQQNGFDVVLNDMQYVEDGLVFAGARNGQGIILKTDFEFNLIWQNTSVALANSDGFKSIKSTSTQGFIANARDVVARYSAQGDTLWSVIIPPVGQRFFCVLEHQNNLFYALKRSYTNGIWLLDTFNDNGDNIASYSTEVPTLIEMGTTNLQTTLDENLVVYLASTQVLTKVSITGETIWSRAFPAITRTGFGSKNMCIDSYGYIVFCGSGNIGAFTLIKADSNGQTSNIDDCLLQPDAVVLSHYPNPVSCEATFKYDAPQSTGTLCFTLFNLKGQKVYSQIVTGKAGEIAFKFNQGTSPSLANGVYLYNISDDSKVIASNKMLIMH